MDVFYEEIGGEDQVFTGFRLVDSSIVAYSQLQPDTGGPLPYGRGSEGKFRAVPLVRREAFVPSRDRKGAVVQSSAGHRRT